MLTNGWEKIDQSILSKEGENMFIPIKTHEDISDFIDKTNALHDGYIIGVQFANNGISRTEDGLYFNSEKTKLTVQILVTSIFDTIIEIEFENIQEWQIKDKQWDIADTTVMFDTENRVVWLDDVYINMDEAKKSSYVIAKSMKWRIV